MKHTIPDNSSLLDALIGFFPNSSKNTLRSWIKEGRVQIEGKVIKNPQFPVLEGQQLTIGSRRKFIENNIQVVYEDSDIIVIDKPSGLLSVSTAFEKEETAHRLLKVHYHPRKILVVHRLDQETSGIMLFAFNEQACQNLKKTFELHHIDRGYAAIVEGQMQSTSGTWESYLYEDANYVVHVTDDPNRGEKAVTHYETIAASKRYSWLNLRLETGKKNQIRVHCQELAGHPVAGDKKYGAQTNPIRRLCLHAYLLSFHHPITNKLMLFESPIPEEFYKIIRPYPESEKNKS